MRRSKLSGLLLGFLATVLTGVATPQPFPPKPEVDVLFKQWDKTTSPGCSLAVAKTGQIIYSRGYGMADLDHGISNAPSTVFHAGSLAKQFTGMSIMLLVQQQRITLDDDVRTHIAELDKTRIELIKIGQMLHHTSGLRDQWTLATMAGWRLSEDTVSLEDVLGLVRRMKTVNFDAGTKFSYSNTNYTLAGLIVGRKNRENQSLAGFAHDNIFKKLNMTSTRFVERHGEVVANRAYGYRGKEKEDFDKPPFEVRMPNYNLTGPTNLVTTVVDLMRWEDNFHTKIVGDDGILGAMQTGGPVHPFYGVGLILGKDAIGGRIIEHDGRDAGYRSHFFRYPDKQLAVALLCNVWMPDRRTHGLVRAVAAAFLQQEPTLSKPPPPSSTVSPGARPLRDYVGRYCNEEIDAVYEVKLDAAGKLWLVRSRYAPHLLTPAAPDPDTFSVKEFSAVLPVASVKFSRDDQGKVNRLIMDDRVPGGFHRLWDFAFRRLP